MKNGDYMTINEEKRQFVESMLENFEGKADRNAYKEGVLKLLLKDTNGGKLYKYRSVTKNAKDNLKNGTLYCAAPSTFNDPFDCKMGIGIWDAYIKWIQDNVNKFGRYLMQFLELSLYQTGHEEYSEDEKIIFRQLSENEEIKNLLYKIQMRNYTDDEVLLIVRDFCKVLISMFGTFVPKEISEVVMQIMQKRVSSIFDFMSIDELDQFESISKISDCAKVFGIVEDGDDTTLLKLIEQKFNPDNVEKMQILDEEINKLQKEMQVKVDEWYRVGCLCSDNKNKLMWSHYANGHRGFCIEYDFSSCWEVLKDVYLLPVLYSRDRVVMTEEVILTKVEAERERKKNYTKTLIKSLITKDDIWNYENEWRIITTAKNGAGNIKMPSISCIYIGALCSNGDKERLIKIAKKMNIPVKQMWVDRDHYELHAQSIS